MIMLSGPSEAGNPLVGLFSRTVAITPSPQCGKPDINESPSAAIVSMLA